MSGHCNVPFCLYLSSTKSPPYIFPKIPLLLFSLRPCFYLQFISMVGTQTVLNTFSQWLCLFLFTRWSIIFTRILAWFRHMNHAQKQTAPTVPVCQCGPSARPNDWHLSVFYWFPFHTCFYKLVHLVLIQREVHLPSHGTITHLSFYLVMLVLRMAINIIPVVYT